MSEPLWKPSAEHIAKANISVFRRKLELDWGVSLPDYAALHAFSLDEMEKQAEVRKEQEEYEYDDDDEDDVDAAENNAAFQDLLRSWAAAQQASGGGGDTIWCSGLHSRKRPVCVACA